LLGGQKEEKGLERKKKIPIEEPRLSHRRKEKDSLSVSPPLQGNRNKNAGKKGREHLEPAGIFKQSSFPINDARNCEGNDTKRDPSTGEKKGEHVDQKGQEEKKKGGTRSGNIPPSNALEKEIGESRKGES